MKTLLLLAGFALIATTLAAPAPAPAGNITLPISNSTAPGAKNVAPAAENVSGYYPDIRFFVDTERRGTRYGCINTKRFNQCYEIQESIRSFGLSSFESVHTGRNRDRKAYSITLYSGRGCTGQWDRWSFEQKFLDVYKVDYFPTINDNVRTFKMADFATSSDSGNANWDPENTESAGCVRI
ncbi:hypothetical protein FBU30_010280 [Linnemannia zychae]|nr:hypothetical protein FBU30_010280 [Linnemannia zychae]